jgi:hypothetical protein
MTEYITIAQVDELLGAGWAGTGDPARAVLMANVWLTERLRTAFDTVPAEVVQAGAEIARDAAAGLLYGAQERDVVSSSVTAGPVTTAKTFSAGAKARTAGESFALALIRPWLTGSQIKLVRG